ncbi:MAG: GNAT family N-acetyltransferase [Betaproteobacteria bacterium]
MTPFTFTLADPVVHRDALININIDYISWLATEIEKSFAISPQVLLGMGVPEYVASVIDKVCGDPPPHGAFYLIRVNNEVEKDVENDVAGMGGLRRMGDGVAEIKRIYVRPAFRGKNLGQSILERLLADAREFGYREIRLDTAPFMQSAQRLYEGAGFVDREPYEGVEVPPKLHAAWRFMECTL